VLLRLPLVLLHCRRQPDLQRPLLGAGQEDLGEEICLLECLHRGQTAKRAPDLLGCLMQQDLAVAPLRCLLHHTEQTRAPLTCSRLRRGRLTMCVFHDRQLTTIGVTWGFTRFHKPSMPGKPCGHRHQKP